MGSAIHEAVLQACRNFMIPIARFLLRNGVTFKEFAEISKWAFVQVAAEDHGIRGRKASVSRISTALGLSRKEVSRLREMPERQTGVAFVSKAAQILSVWRQDPDFLGADGNPRPVPVTHASDVDFVELARRAGEDSDYPALLDELQRARAVSFTESGLVSVSSRYYIPVASDPEYVQRFGLRLRDLAQTIDHNSRQLNKVNRRFEATAYTMRLDSRYVTRFRSAVAEQGVGFLRQIDEWLGSHEASGGEPGRPQTAGVGVYLFEEEIRAP